MWGAVFAGLAVLVTLANAQTRTANGACYEAQNTYQMVFTVNKNSDTNLNYVYAINSTENQLDTCSSVTRPDLINVTSTTVQIIIDVDKNTLVESADCAYTNNGLVFEWRFMTTTYANVMTGNDVLFVLTCDFNDATPTFISTTKYVSGTPAENLPADNSRGFALEIIDAITGSVVNTIPIGTSIRFRIRQVSGEQVSITGHTCYASPDNLFGDSKDYELINSVGCPRVYGVTTLITAGFTPGILSPNTAISTSGVIEQFQFVGTLDVHYQCIVHYCTAGNNECSDFCLYNSVARRKKRDVDEDSTAEAFIKITYYTETANDSHEKGCESKEVAPSCLNDVGVITAFSILGGLVLLTIVVTICVFIRSSRLLASQHRKETS